MFDLDGDIENAGRDQPLRPDREARKKRIVQISSELFLQKGYHATTMSEISAFIGGSKGTLWNYYPNKKLLFQHVVKYCSEEAYKTSLSPFDDLKSPRISLLEHTRIVMRDLASPRSLATYRMVIGAATTNPDAGPTYNKFGISRWNANLTKFLFKNMDICKVDRDVSELHAKMFTGLCLSGYYNMLILGVISVCDHDRLNDEIEKCIAILFGSREMILRP